MKQIKILLLGLLCIASLSSIGQAPGVQDEKTAQHYVNDEAQTAPDSFYEVEVNDFEVYAALQDTSASESEELEELVDGVVQQFKDRPEKGSDIKAWGGWVVALALLLWGLVTYFRKRYKSSNPPV